MISRDKGICSACVSVTGMRDGVGVVLCDCAEGWDEGISFD